MSAMTVGELCQMLLFEIPATWDQHPTRDAVVQFTLDGDTFYAIDQIVECGDGGIVAQLMPWPNA